MARVREVGMENHEDDWDRTEGSKACELEKPWAGLLGWRRWWERQGPSMDLEIITSAYGKDRKDSEG